MENIKHKRFVCLPLAIMLCIVTFVYHDGRAQIDEPQKNYETLVHLGLQETAKSICSDGAGGGYLLTSTALYSFTVNGQAVDIICPNDKQLVALSIFQGQLYGLSSTQEIMHLRNSTWELLFQAPWGKDELPITQASMCQNENDLYYIYMDQEDRNVFCTFSIQTGEFFQKEIFDAPWCAFDTTKNAVLGFLYNEKEALWYVAAYTNASEEAVPLMEMGYGSYENYTYDSSGDVFYGAGEIGQTNLMRITWDGGKDVVIGVPAMLNLLTAISEEALAGIRNNALMIYTPMKKVADEITIYGYASPFNQSFTQQTGIAINEREPRNTSDMEAIAAAMSTGDDSVDIFTIMTDNSLKLIKDKGFYVDLRSSSILEEALGELYPKLASIIVTQKQQIVAWPIDTFISLLGIETWTDQLLLQYDPGYQRPETWDEALDLIHSLDEKEFFEQNNFVPFALWAYNQEDVLNYIVQEYLLGLYNSGQKVTFDTLAFRNLASRVLEEVPLVDPWPRTDGMESVLFEAYSMAGGLHENMSLPLRIDPNEPAKVNAAFRVMIINPYSKHQGEALAFLEYMATKRTAEDYGLYQTLDQPVFDEAAFKEWEKAVQALAGEQAKIVPAEDQKAHEDRIVQMQESVDSAKNYLYIISPEAIADYHKFEQHFVILEDSLIMYNEKLEGMIGKMVHGSLPLDDFIQQADSYLQMIMEERGK